MVDAYTEMNSGCWGREPPPYYYYMRGWQCTDMAGIRISAFTPRPSPQPPANLITGRGIMGKKKEEKEEEKEKDVCGPHQLWGEMAFLISV